MVKVLGYGDNVADDYIEQKFLYPGGNALNFAYYAHELGEESAFLGNIADDFVGKHICQILSEHHIEYDRCPIMENTTTWRCPVIIRENDRIFLEDDVAENQIENIRFEPWMKDYMDQFDLVHLACYIEREDDVAKFHLDHALVSYDFSNEITYHNKEYYDKVCPYIDFALFSSSKSMENTKKRILEIYDAGCPCVLATRGVEGQIYYDGTFHYGTIEKVEAIDTCGAGDSFATAFLIYMLKKGWKGRQMESCVISEALQFAAHYSALNCMKKGALGISIEYE